MANERSYNGSDILGSPAKTQEAAPGFDGVMREENERVKGYAIKALSKKPKDYAVETTRPNKSRFRKLIAAAIKIEESGAG